MIDLTGEAIRVCVCGCDIFKTLVRFDELGQLSWYTLTGYCENCGSKVTLPTPVDD